MTVQEVIKLAGDHLIEVYSEASSSRLRLEGFDRGDDHRFWLITLSYPRPEERLESYRREFRTMKIRDADGELVGIRTGMLPDWR